MADSQRKSYNLFDEQYGTITTTIQYIPLNVGEGTFTLSTTTPISGNSACLFFLAGNVSSGASGDNNVYLRQNRTVTSINGYVTIGYRTTNSLYPSSYKTILNTGSTALPYEPYGWIHSLRKQCSATETIASGDILYANGTAISNYTIKGNTVQNGTPSPSNPVAVNGVGERTANLLNPEGSWTDFNCSHSVSGGNITVTGKWFSYLAFTAKPNTTYGIKYNNVPEQHIAVYKNSVSGTPLATTYTDFVKFTTDTDTQLYIVFYANIGSSERTVEYKNVRLYEGDYTSQTIPDYEPYGFKIPILTTQTTPIYLGSVSSTRQIKKFVLTGDDGGTWSINLAIQNGTSFFNPDIFTGYKTNVLSGYCTHYPVATAITDTIGVYYGGNINFITDFSEGLDTVEKWREYLRQQYATGTPVIVWYVLATPQTAVVNEPLMKIGTYTDSISNAASIPTTDGANTITVDTTVQPSEFSATWTGWHDASVKEKSENLIPTNISDWEQGGMSSTTGTDTVSTIRLRTKDYYPIENDTDYYISVNDTDYCYVNIILYNSSKQYLGQYFIIDMSINGATALAINIPSSTIANVSYYRVVLKRQDDNTILVNEISNVKPMLNLGSTAQTYEPYWK